ncbi:MAG: squalene/phytoene synthase family protein [Corynebacterium sp.]|nr:squalene/phytoene synthase family protein [Corynebacterium sp.]
MAIRAARQVIHSYSTSFGLATRMLGKQQRIDIQNLYAMVRIADEIVDGTSNAAGLDPTTTGELLDAYEQQVLAAPHQRFHTDPVLHAYAITARRCEFPPEHIQAFFTSMRTDLHTSTHDAASCGTYIYGSAEVIGLLCVSVFVTGEPVAVQQRERLEVGARALGAAFQKINFLRDYAEDSKALGRQYFPPLTESAKAQVIQDIRLDLHQAQAAIMLLPASSRTGVILAARMFTELTAQIERTDIRSLLATRVRLPQTTRARIIAQVCGESALIRLKQKV